MFYHKYLWVVGVTFIVIGIIGISQGKLISGIDF